jgi:outer membrane lipoprotein SlyB
MKISGNISIEQKQFHQTCQVKNEKGELDRVTIEGSENKQPDFINDGKLLSQMAKTKENSKTGKVLGALTGAAILGGMAAVFATPLGLGIVAAGLLTACGSIAGGVIGAVVGNTDTGNTSKSGNTDDAAMKSMQTTVAITTGNIGLLSF